MQFAKVAGSWLLSTICGRCASMRAWACEIVHKLARASAPDQIDATIPMQGWISILIMIALGAGFALISVLLSSVLGPRKPTPEKSAPYECGMPAVGDARERQSVKFYLVAMIFLLFDIEVAFLYPWAMALRDLGWTGFGQVVLFMVLLLAGYVYVWRKGALDWGNEKVVMGLEARNSRPDDDASRRWSSGPAARRSGRSPSASRAARSR